MYYVYLIKSINHNWTYIGFTEDLKKRFAEHQAGRTRSNKSYRPFRLVYYEAYSSKTDASAREYKLKHHSQTKELLIKQISGSLIN